ncbi:E3 ubiquitin-protein ligase Rnf220-like [Tropilaelaps mercedesae]|uniref:E3 ubiquitin-protein ligase Rnf220-like n=1 Tax=Tropilaelaps mercedesae TaxID=418985 RepID=A0A1V9XCE8_9ACAR|nr:E3 ubiquitin-protein ligase Rnf220-like [Tropilaelaps mercedesae]
MPRRKLPQSTAVESADDGPQAGPSQENSEESSVPKKRGSSRRSLSQWTTSTSCPVCGVTIRLSEATAHYETEVMRLDEVGLSRSVRRAGTSSHHDKHRSGADESREQRRLQWKRVRRNRSSRLTARTGPLHLRRRLAGNPTGVNCPICDCSLDHLVNDDERTRHVDECLAQSNNSPSRPEGDAVDVDVEGSTDESESGMDDAVGLDEYEWAGQTRVRAHTAFTNLIPRSNRTGQEEDIGDLDVDGDEETIYGQPQFTEADLIPTSTDNSTQLIREAMVRTAGANDGTPSGLPSKWDTIEDLSRTDHLDLSHDGDEADQDDEAAKSDREEISAPKSNGSSKSALVIDSLKARIRELEANMAAAERSRCLVCLQPFTSPLASVVCWHVYCQDCWLKTLSCKKLCPLCSMITSPGDLRRIYL